MNILFCGGGTLGPVTPLLAVLRQMRLRKPQMRCAWIGTNTGPEAGVVEAEGVPFHAITVAKLPRYPSSEWLKFPMRYYAAHTEAERIVERERPQLIVTAGGYSGVPVIRIGAREGIPCALHQLDVEPGWANRAVAQLCSSVTTSFRADHQPFGASIDAVQIETPCRFSLTQLPTREEARAHFQIREQRPVILVVGGGTGALAINRAIGDVLDELLQDAEVIHVTGRGKMEIRAERQGYQAFELLQEEQMRHAYVAADVVIARAGIGTLSELAALKKAAIVIPIPHSHQEANARAVQRGVVWLHQETQGFADVLRDATLALLKEQRRRLELGAALHQLLPTDQGNALAERWLRVMG